MVVIQWVINWYERYVILNFSFNTPSCFLSLKKSTWKFLQRRCSTCILNESTCKQLPVCAQTFTLCTPPPKKKKKSAIAERLQAVLSWAAQQVSFPQFLVVSWHVVGSIGKPDASKGWEKTASVCRIQPEIFTGAPRSAAAPGLLVPNPSHRTLWHRFLPQKKKSCTQSLFFFACFFNFKKNVAQTDVPALLHMTSQETHFGPRSSNNVTDTKLIHQQKLTGIVKKKNWKKF